MREDGRDGLIPPLQPPQVGLVARKVFTSHVHVGEGLTQRRAMGHLRGQLAFAGQFADDGCRFSCDCVEDVTPAVRHGCRNCQAFARQVLHQPQVVGELFVAEALKEGQNVGLRNPVVVNRHEEIAVFNAATDAIKGGQLAELQRVNECLGFSVRNVGVNSHKKSAND